MIRNKVQDDIYTRLWLEDNTRLCPHPGVIKKYGHDGQCRVCIYTCMKCRYAVRFSLHGGVACGYEGAGRG